ncbi:hypothetical protein Q4I32_003136 [Leishmania shawi]|uniref:Uncharacterized protein n=1 Tax=Leishmania shawi TaxID=5680 RepID=A0AAW3C0U9_9TRYP
MEPEISEHTAPAAAGSATPPQEQITHDPIDPQQELSSPPYNSYSHHRSPRTEELNRSMLHSWPSSASASASAYGPGQVDSGVLKGQITAHQQQQGRAEHSLKGSGNYANPCTPQQGLHSVTPLTPLSSASRVKTVNCIYTPPRLDSQLLASPWPGYGWAAGQAPSPTRAGGTSAPLSLAPYWHATSSPIPYPSGSLTSYHSGCRLSSPSMQSLRLLPLPQQHSHNGVSPVQLSCSNLGHENSFPTAASSCASPGNIGVVHSAILDAPLQVSLMPPPYHDDRPLFSFSNSIVQSAPFTRTLPTSSSRTQSIYHDAMIDLAYHKDKVDNPLAAVLFDGARPAVSGGAANSHDTNPVRGSDITSSFGNAAATGSSFNGHLYNSAVSALMEDGFVGKAEILVSMGSMDWWRLERPSSANLSLVDQLTGRPGDRRTGSLGIHMNVLDNENEDIRFSEEEEDEMERARQSFNRTPRALASTGRDTQTSAIVIPAADIEGPTSEIFDGASLPAPLDHTARPDRTDGKTATLSLPVSILAYSDDATTMDATTAVTAPSHGRAVEIATPLVNLPLRPNGRPTTPAGAPAIALAGRGIHDFHLFMPSPIDQGAPVFGGMRDSVTRNSSSEPSTSTLSLVPAVGMWQASPTIFSAWHSLDLVPTAEFRTAHSLQDLLEMLRLLQSDIDNVYNEVSLTEQLVRRGIRSTLSMLLQLITELVHSVALAASEASDGMKESTASAEQAASYVQLQVDLTAAAASCDKPLRAAIDAVKREQENLEPLLFTTMLARGAIGSLLQFLEKPYVAAKTPSGTTTTTIPTLNEVCAPSKQHGGCNSSAYASTGLAVTPLTPERIEELMGNKTLQEELNSKWPQFTSTYNRQVLRYLCLRALYVALNRDDNSAGELATEQQGCCTTIDADAPATASTTLETVVSAWVEEQVLLWTAQQPTITPKYCHATSANPTFDDADRVAVREGLCGALPSFERVAEVLSVYRDGEVWRWWYSLLSHAMLCNFHVRENKRIFSYVEKQLLDSSAASAVAMRNVLARQEVTVEEVEEELEKVELELSTMEESGKAQRVTILQRILRRIFVFALVSSVQRTLGKDTPVLGSQLATYVQLQRKPLVDVEAQLSAHHTECTTHVKHIHTFVSHFPGTATAAQPSSQSQLWTLCRTTTASGVCNHMNQTHLSLISSLSPDLQPDDTFFQWNSPTVASLEVLFTHPKIDKGTMDRSEGVPTVTTTATGAYTDGSGADRARAAAALIRDLTTRLVATVQSLCTLLQSDVDITEAHEMFCTSPTKMCAPSTRALRRLQASLAETNQCIRACMASLHIVD